jgi:hypothetical protein
VKLPAWLRPIKEGTVRATRRILRAPPSDPTLEEFVSPLREGLKEDLAVKEAIGYNRTCTECTRQHGIDTRMGAKVADAEDPQPWLVQLHTELIETRKEMAFTRERIQSAKQFYNPLNRMRWLAAGGFVSAMLLIANEGIKYILPYLLSLIP